MSKTIEAKRIVALLGLAMAVLLVLSVLTASDVEAKKKRHHHRPPTPALNVVQCPTEGDKCFGTSSGDYLVGRDDQFDQIEGAEGDDLYDGKGGSDFWQDFSTTSNDTYLVPATEFSAGGSGTLGIEDFGGNSDVLDLSAYRSTEFAVSNSGGNLLMDGPGKRDIILPFFFTTDSSIDFFKFKDGTLTADQVKSKV